MIQEYRILFRLCVFLFLFVDYAVLGRLGWIQGPGIKAVFSIQPQVYLLFILFFLFCMGRREMWRGLIAERNLLLILFATFLSSLLAFRTYTSLVLLQSLFPAALLSVIFAKVESSQEILFFRKMLIYFFCVECFVAILEAIMHINIFPFAIGTEGYSLSDKEYEIFGMFRSSALHGHPLSNALLLDVVMSFILVASDFSEKKKVMLYLLGMVALLCFNARSSILFMSFVLIVYAIRMIVLKKVGIAKKTIFLFLPLAAFSGGMYLFNKFGFGGRIFSNGLMDASANTRFEILDVLENFSLMDYLWGMDVNYFRSLVLMKVNGGHMENYWVMFLAYYGLIFFVPIVFFYARLLWKHVDGLNFFGKIVVLGTLIIVSSTNNSLAYGVPALCFFVICANVFCRKGVSFA